MMSDVNLEDNSVVCWCKITKIHNQAWVIVIPLALFLLNISFLHSTEGKTVQPIYTLYLPSLILVDEPVQTLYLTPLVLRDLHVNTKRLVHLELSIEVKLHIDRLVRL